MKFCNRGSGITHEDDTRLSLVLGRMNNAYAQLLPCNDPESMVLFLQNSQVLATSDSSTEKSMVSIQSPEELLMPLDDIVNSARALAQSQRKINDPAQETQCIHIEGTKHMFSIFQLSDTPCRRVVAMATCECVRPVLDMKFISPALSEHLEEVRQVVGTAYLSTGPPR